MTVLATLYLAAVTGLAVLLTIFHARTYTLSKQQERGREGAAETHWLGIGGAAFEHAEPNRTTSEVNHA